MTAAHSLILTLPFHDKAQCVQGEDGQFALIVHGVIVAHAPTEYEALTQAQHEVLEPHTA